MTEIFHHLKTISSEFYKIFRIIFRGWHLRKVINFSNFFKLLCLYIFAIVWVIFVEMDYSKNFWTKAIHGNFSDKRFSFYSVSDRIGESTLYDRIVTVNDKLGLDYSAFKFSEPLSEFFLSRHFYYVSTSIVNYIFKPQFNLALTHHVNILPWGYNVTYLNMPLDSLFDNNKEFTNKLSHLHEYDAYADLYSCVHGSNKLLSNMIKKSGKNKPVMALYLAQEATEYSKAPMNKALITGTLWGCNRKSLRIASALKKLAEEELLEAVGLRDFLGFLGKSYLGRMEDFGKPLEVIRQLQQKYGISLIIHNQEHMLDGIPTSRISEAASSGGLIISDQNLFLTKFFGDSVLYFDAFGSEEKVYSQIKAHIKWAQSNPDQAHSKTKKAYQIFMDNFTLEEQLGRLFERVEL